MKSRSIFLIMIINILNIQADDAKHVHFKIYIPELINRHIHTKTVWVYVHSPPHKKKNKNNYPKKHNYYNENYNIWSTSYEENEENYNKQQNQGEPPFYDDYKETITDENSESVEEDPSPVSPPRMNFETGVTGYSYPPQYQINHNNFNNNNNNHVDDSSYERVEYDQGHHQAGKIKTGHLYTDDEYNQFYNNKLEESSAENNIIDNASNNKFKYLRNNNLIKLRAG
ncbi:homeobox protein 2-like [Microplitis mediator]|uniref:homeobox protein 2-like n=1 Tax=Microplitis mediator TaxID=375433 RepID=UPI0025573772|nr:homeobox protein 2-like [Microplitis mediator]